MQLQRQPIQNDWSQQLSKPPMPRKQLSSNPLMGAGSEFVHRGHSNQRQQQQTPHTQYPHTDFSVLSSPMTYHSVGASSQGAPGGYVSQPPNLQAPTYRQYGVSLDPFFDHQSY
jgi:hypothetical protein